MNRPSGLNIGRDNSAPGKGFSHNVVRRSKSINRTPAAEVAIQVPVPVGWRIQSPRKKPSTTFSAGPPVDDTRQVSGLPRKELNTTHCPSGDHTGQESAASSLVSWRRPEPSTFCVQMSELPV